MVIDTPLLVIGHGPAALVAAKVAGGRGLNTLLAGHEPLGGETPVVLDEAAVAVLTPNGVLNVLRPYLTAVDPPAIAPVDFEDVVKHHCVVDMNVTVYDGMTLVEAAPRPGGGITGVLSDGRSRWELVADAFIDAGALPSTLPEAVSAGGAAADAAVAAVTARSGAAAGHLG